MYQDALMPFLSSLVIWLIAPEMILLLSVCVYFFSTRLCNNSWLVLFYLFLYDHIA